MADVVRLGAIPPAQDPIEMLRDLRTRLDAGADIGSRVAHIKDAIAAMRAYAGGLRRLLEAPDASLLAKPVLMAEAERVLIITERSIACGEEFLRNRSGNVHLFPRHYSVPIPRPPQEP